jgi:hypothetical protein
MLELAQPASGDDPKSTSSALVGPTASSNPGTKFAPNKILPGVNSSAALYLRPRRGAGLLRPISALNSINPSPSSRSVSNPISPHVKAPCLYAPVAIPSSSENRLTIRASIAIFPNTSRSKGCFCTTYHPENRNSAGLSSHQRHRVVGERSRSLLLVYI